MTAPDEIHWHKRAEVEAAFMAMLAEREGSRATFTEKFKEYYKEATREEILESFAYHSFIVIQASKVNSA